MKKLSLIIILVSVMMLNISCGKSCSLFGQGDISSVGDSHIQIELIDKLTGMSLIRDTLGIYTPSDIQLLNDKSEVLPIKIIPKTNNTLNREYYLRFRTLEASVSNHQSGKEYKSSVNLMLKSEKNIIEYTFKIKDFECGGNQLEFINIKYNDSAVVSATNVMHVTFEIKK